MKPTMREVKVILNNKNIEGWNDRRTYGGRIKMKDYVLPKEQCQRLREMLAS